jgi:hypothetical protein
MLHVARYIINLTLIVKNKYSLVQEQIKLAFIPITVI